MDFFFFVFILIVILLAYWSNREQPHEGKIFVVVIGLLIIAYGLNQSGLTIPNTGITYSGSTASFTGTTYTVSSLSPFSINGNDSPYLFAVFWGSFILGILGFVDLIGYMLNKSRNRRIING